MALYAQWFLNGNGNDATASPANLTISGASGTTVGSGNGFDFDDTTSDAEVTFTASDKLYTNFHGKLTHTIEVEFIIDTLPAVWSVLAGYSSSIGNLERGVVMIWGDGSIGWSCSDGNTPIGYRTTGSAVTTGTRYRLTFVYDATLASDRGKFYLATGSGSPALLTVASGESSPQNAALTLPTFSFSGGEVHTFNIATRGNGGRKLDAKVSYLALYDDAHDAAKVAFNHGNIDDNNDADPNSGGSALTATPARLHNRPRSFSSGTTLIPAAGTLVPVAQYWFNGADSGTSPSVIPQLIGAGDADLQSFGSVHGWATNTGGRLFGAQYMAIPSVLGTVFDALAGATQITTVLYFVTSSTLPAGGEVLFEIGQPEVPLGNQRLGVWCEGTGSSLRFRFNNADIVTGGTATLSANTAYVLVSVLDTPNATAAQRARLWLNGTLDGFASGITQNATLSFGSGSDELKVGAPFTSTTARVGWFGWYLGAATSDQVATITTNLLNDHDSDPLAGGGSGLTALAVRIMGVPRVLGSSVLRRATAGHAKATPRLFLARANDVVVPARFISKAVARSSGTAHRATAAVAKARPREYAADADLTGLIALPVSVKATPVTRAASTRLRQAPALVRGAPFLRRSIATVPPVVATPAVTRGVPRGRPSGAINFTILPTTPKVIRAWPRLRAGLAALIGGASSFLGSGASVLVRPRFAATLGHQARFVATAGHELRFAVSITTRVTMSQIFEGSEVRIEVAVTTAAGQPVNASSAELKLKSPSGVVTTYTLGTAPYIQDAVGRYHLDLIASEPGQWDIVARGMSVLGAGANYTGKSWFLVEPA